MNEISDAYVHPLDIATTVQAFLYKNGDEFLNLDIPREKVIASQAKTCTTVKAVVALCQAFHNDKTGALDTEDFNNDSETIVNETFRLLDLDRI